jgi:hypothetical protein
MVGTEKMSLEKGGKSETRELIGTSGVVMWHRVARWYIFRPKIAIWVNLGGSYDERFWCILWTFFYFTAI